MKHYRSAEKKADGLYLILHQLYGKQLWVSVQVRKQHKCEITDKAIEPKDRAYRPMTNGYNRMHRISQAGMELLEAL